MSQPVVLRTYADRLHAELARSVLEAEGIEAFVAPSEGMAGTYVNAYMGEGITPHELRVAEPLAAEAEAVLKETEGGEWEIDDDGIPQEPDAVPTTPAGVCPVCKGSLEGDDPGFTAIWRMGVVGIILLFVTWYPASFLPAPIPLIYDLATSLVILFGLWVLRGFFVRSRCGHCGLRRLHR